MRVISTTDGHIVYNNRGTVTAQKIDQQTLRLSGKPMMLAEAWSDPSASHTGSIVFRSSGYPITQLTWVGRDGRRESTVGAPDTYAAIELSPTGTRAAVVRAGPWIYNMDLLMADLTTGVFSRLTNHPGLESDPVWSPDEGRIAYSSNQSGHWLPFEKDLITGKETPAIDVPDDLALDDWTADGRFLIVRNMGRGGVLALHLASDRKLKTLTESPWRKDQSQVSPDGTLIAFESDESGASEVYVARFPDFTDKKQVSASGGSQPRWRRDRRELFYISADSMMMSVTVGTGVFPAFGTPVPLFRASHDKVVGISQYDVAGDGRRFLILEPTQPPRELMTFLLNWVPPDSK